MHFAPESKDNGLLSFAAIQFIKVEIIHIQGCSMKRVVLPFGLYEFLYFLKCLNTAKKILFKSYNIQQVEYLTNTHNLEC